MSHDAARTWHMTYPPLVIPMTYDIRSLPKQFLSLNKEAQRYFSKCQSIKLKQPNLELHEEPENDIENYLLTFEILQQGIAG